MKKMTLLVSTIAAAVILTSCSVTMPLSVSAAPIGNKVGTSSTTVIPILGNWHMNKNFGIGDAAHNGKIAGGVATADMKVKWIPVLRAFYYTKEVVVTGN